MAAAADRRSYSVIVHLDISSPINPPPMFSSTRRLACSNFTRRLCSSPFQRLRLTKNPCLSLLQRCKTLNQLKQLHCQILISGLLASSDVANRLMVFLTNLETGELDYAHKVFDSLPNPSLFLYNLMIKALAKKGYPKCTLLLFDRMREAVLSPDNFTYPFVLKAIASISIFSEGRKAHGLIVKSGFEFDPYVRNSLVNMYAEMGCVEIARSLFDETHVRDVVCWNVLIAVYVKCGKFEEAVAVFRMMERERVEPDEATLVSTLSACIRLGNLELGKEIQRYVNERSRFSIPASNALMDLYVKCGCVDIARTLFDDMPAKNVISWTTMMSGYVSSGLLDEARKLFDRSPTRDVVLWTAMINGYVQYNHFEEALAMSREMQMARIKPDKFTVVSLLTICANFGALEQGKWIHGYIEENMIKVDLVVATALMDMYAKCGSVEKSLEIFKRVERKDGAMWTSIICGHAMNGQTDKALELFSEMKREGVQLDDITFSGVLSACNHGGLVENGRRHFREMELYHIEPKPEHYACLVDLLVRAGLLDEAETLIRSLPSVNDGDVLPLWGALLGACRIHGNVDMGHRIAEELIDMVNHRVDERKLPPLINRPVTRSFGAILAINAAAAVADKRPVTSRDGGKGEVIIRPMPEEVIVISPDTAEVSSSRKKKVHTLTSVLIARSKLACGVTDKGKDSAHDIDALDRDNQLAVTDYVEDIYKFYKFSESSSRPRDYMGSQVEINSQMRAVLADWLIEVHQKFRLRPETLYLTFYIIDRYLSLESTRKRELQLVGVSAMLIASKYEEIWAPEVKDFISISNKAYTREQILVKEKGILNKLEWSLTVPTPYVFLVQFLKAASGNKEMEHMVFFFAELGLMQYSMIMYCPSMVAAAAVYAARCTLHKSPLWSETLKRHSGFSEPELLDCAEILVNCHSTARDSKLKVVFKKYSGVQFGAVALHSPATKLMEDLSAQILLALSLPGLPPSLQEVRRGAGRTEI